MDAKMLEVYIDHKIPDFRDPQKTTTSQSPCHVTLWILCKNNYKYKKFCQAALKILSLLFHRGGIIFCKVCGQCNSCSPSEHIVLYCKNNENIRMKLWKVQVGKDLSEGFGCNFHLWYISLSPFRSLHYYRLLKIRLWMKMIRSFHIQLIRNVI